MIQNLTPGSYIFSHPEPVLTMVSFRLQTPPERLHIHPDFQLIRNELSIGIDIIRQASHFLRIMPALSNYKILVIENFHLATIEAQNAFLKTFEEPPDYAYIFLITPYPDRLLKTIVSRAQVIQIQNSKLKKQTPKAQIKTQKLKEIIKMSISERLLWLESEVKDLDDKVQLKLTLLEMIDAFLQEALAPLKEGKFSIYAVEYLKETRWKIEQGFPNPKLLVEGFLVML